MKQELEILCQAIRMASTRVLELQLNGFETFRKKDRSPVTSADLEVNRILREVLLSTFPDDGWMSEETPDDPQRLKKKRVWIIDPIDGTKYFMKGIPQFSISVALIENQEPVIGVVHNPATDEMFSAIRESGAHLNGHPIHMKQPQGGDFRVLVNPSRLKRGEFQAYERLFTLQPMGSIAYTLALVAAGRADATLNFNTLNEWDIAAGWLLVKEAGGVAFDRQWKPISYNQPTTFVHGILAMASETMDQVKTLLQQAL